MAYRLTSTAYTLTCSILPDTTGSFFARYGIYTNISYDRTGTIIRYTVQDTINLVQEYCLDVEQIDLTTGSGYRNLTTLCSTPSGSVQYNYSAYAGLGEIVARGRIHTRSNYSEYVTDVVSILSELTAATTLGTAGVFLGFLIIGTVGMAGLVLGGPPVGVIGIVLGLITTALTGIIQVSLLVVVGVSIVGVIIAVMASEGT